MLKAPGRGDGPSNKEAGAGGAGQRAAVDFQGLDRSGVLAVQGGGKQAQYRVHQLVASERLTEEVLDQLLGRSIAQGRLGVGRNEQNREVRPAAPRLPRFQKAHPEVALRVVASNDVVDLKREQIDVAIRFATLEMPVPGGEKLFDYLQFPVCAPSLARSRRTPLRTLADLGRHVLIDFETTVYGRVWYDWQRWSAAMRLEGVRGRSWIRFSHYDQVIDAACNGTGVAMSQPLTRTTLRP